MKKRLILTNAVIIIIGFIAAFFYTAVQIQKQYKEEFTNRMETALALLTTQEEQILANPEGIAAEVGNRLSQSEVQMRISIISLSGKVLGDSTRQEINQNHLNRPEIRQALQTGHGFDTRMSASVHERYYYDAVYIPGKFYLRAALPTAQLDTSILRLWITAAFGMILGIIIVCTFTAYFVYRVTSPMLQLTEAAKKISGGDYTGRVDGTFQDEIGELAKSFNLMAANTGHAFSQLKSQQKQLEGVLQGMNDGVLAVGKNNQLLFLNQSACRLLKNETLQTGKKLEGSLLIHKISDFMKNTTENNQTLKQDIAAEDGQQYTIYTAPIPGQQTPASLAVISDVTRLRKLERLRSEFVANVTHELKTPLTSIRGSIDLLRSADRDEKTRRYFFDVLDIETERLGHLIDDMLVLSQIENAKDDPSARPCSVTEAIDKCVKRLQPVAEKYQVEISVEAETDLFVACSQTRLQQMFSNLIENAIKYNVPNGRVLVCVQKNRKTAVIRFTDTGIGIAPQHFERLFERFYRVDTSRSREIGGTGLGLSIVKHLAVLYGGEVSVESEAGKGSTFTVRLPVSETPE